MKHLGIVVAVTAEARSLVKLPIAPGEAIHLPDGVLMQLSGIGAKRAHRAAKALLEKGATALLSWGSAGGLIATLSPGSLVLPHILIGADQTAYPTDTTWHERLSNRLKGYVDLHHGPLAESITVLKSSAEKAFLFRLTGAIAVDMESGAVAAVAQEAGVPFMAIRAIADPVDVTIPHTALTAIDEFGRLDPVRLIKGLMRNPSEFFSLIRLGRNFRTAQNTLSMVAHMTGKSLLVPQ